MEITDKENTSRKSICFLPNRLILGGIEKVLINALWVLHTKYDIEIVIFFDDRCQAVIDEVPPDVKVTLKQLPENKILKYCSKIPYLSGFYFNKALGNKFYDYLITLRPSVIQACFANIAKHKIYWSHNDFYKKYTVNPLSFKMRVKKKILKTIYKKHHMVWTVSKTIENDIKNGLSLNNIYALANPINCTEIQNKSNVNCDLLFDQSKTNIIMLGRISKEKGFSRVVRFMCDSVFSKYPNTHLYIIGDGPTRTRFENYINKQGFNDKISLLGAKENPYPYLKQAQLFICPSTNESFGLALLEAMLLKIPIITTATVGGKYLTQNNTYGCCVENNDTALQKAVEEFLNDASSYKYSLEEAHQWAWKHDIKIFGERLISLLDECERN